MDILASILFGLIALLILFVVCGFVYINLDLNWSCAKIKKEMDERDRKRNNVETRLTNALKSLCAQLNLPLTYHENLGTAAGKIVYHSNGSGRLILENAKIEILSKYENEPYVLAHELGHYMSIKQHEDSSEKSADQQALVLCKSILTHEEQELMQTGLRCYFEYNING